MHIKDGELIKIDVDEELPQGHLLATTVKACPRGRVKQKCQYFAGIDPMVVHAQHGWWFPEQPGEEPWLRGAWESNVNVLTDDDHEHCNQISGGLPLRTGLCKVNKVTTY